MEAFVPFSSSYETGPPHWHHRGPLNRSIHDDSGYASEDSDPVPLVPSDTDDFHGYSDQFDHSLPWTRRPRTGAFNNAQWLPPAAFKASSLSSEPFIEGWRNYELPQPLAFEQQRKNYDTNSRLRSTTFYNQDSYGDDFSHAASPWEFEENVPTLDFEEHRTRVPRALPSLRNRIESETGPSSSSLMSIRHSSPVAEVRLQAPPSGSSITSAQPDNRTESSIPSSAQHSCQDQSPNHDTQLATAWQQLNQERTELEKELRALERRKRSLLLRKEQNPSSQRGL